MKKINIKVQKTEKYPILIGNGAIKEIAPFLIKHHRNKKLALITDKEVEKHCGEQITKHLNELKPHKIVLESGEQTKSRKIKAEIENNLLKNNFGKDSIIIAFGGGVIGDLAGYVASTFNRGIPYIQVPTTLLAMVDSSVGGKTGINNQFGKNLVGTIYQPNAVFTDINYLKTLPQGEFLNGLAEIIKIASVLDVNLFSYIEDNKEKILHRDDVALIKIINKSIKLKQDVVSKDAFETGLRQILNFGHTIGHAIEKESDFKIKHGYSVSIGMVVESTIAMLQDQLKEKTQKRIIRLLNDINLPTKIKQTTSNKNLIKTMETDKKAKNNKPHFVILKSIGKVLEKNKQFSFEVPIQIINLALNKNKK